MQDIEYLKSMYPSGIRILQGWEEISVLHLPCWIIQTADLY